MCFCSNIVLLWDAERNQDSMKQSRAMQTREDQDNQKLAANSHFQHVISKEWEPWDVLQWTKILDWGLLELKKKKKKTGKRAHAKTETVEVFGSLCNVLLFWLHVKMLDFWKQPPKLLEYVTEYLGVGAGGLTKKQTLTKNYIKRIEHIQNIPTTWKRTQTQQNSFSFVWGPSAITFKLLLRTQTIIGLKPLCM